MTKQKIVEAKPFKPNYRNTCDNCDQRPTVFVTGSQAYDSDLCGPCYFGTAKALDPEKWGEC